MTVILEPKRPFWSNGNGTVSIIKVAAIITAVGVIFAGINQTVSWITKSSREDITAVNASIDVVRDSVISLRRVVDTVRVNVGGMYEILEFVTYVSCAERKNKYDTYVPPVCRNIEERVMRRGIK